VLNSRSPHRSARTSLYFGPSKNGPLECSLAPAVIVGVTSPSTDAGGPRWLLKSRHNLGLVRGLFNRSHSSPGCSNFSLQFSNSLEKLQGRGFLFRESRYFARHAITQRSLEWLPHFVESAGLKAVPLGARTGLGGCLIIHR
jgi:hypothetical protein